MSDEMKDFHYYADKAEASANEALFWADQLLNSRMFELYLRRSEMYARLAAGAPNEPRKVELHQADCSCVAR